MGREEERILLDFFLKTVLHVQENDKMGSRWRNPNPLRDGGRVVPNGKAGIVIKGGPPKTFY